jgi:bacteriophage N4 adsorption protein A
MINGLKRNNPFRLTLCGTLGFTCLLSTTLAFSAEPAHINIDHYADKIKIERTENYLQQLIREYSGFPHLDKAHRLAKKGKTEEAIAEFKHYLNIDPLDVKARMSYSLFLYQNKRYAAVLAELDKILKSHPEFIPARLYHGLAMQSVGDYASANQDFDKVLSTPNALANERRLALSSRIDISIGLKQYQKAYEAQEQLSGIEPTFDSKEPSFNTFYRKGVLLEKLSRSTDAIAAYQTAVSLTRLNSEKLKALRAIAEAAIQSGNWLDANLSNQQILQLAPDDQHAMRSLAFGLNNLKNRSEATQWIKKLLALQDNNKDREFLANLLNEAHLYREAGKEYSKLSVNFKDSGDRRRALMALGYCYQQLAQPKDAAAAFQKAALISKDRQSLEALAMTQEASGQTNAAIDTYRRLEKIVPNAKRHLKVADLLSSKHRYQEACAEYLNALPRLSKKDESYHARMALGYCYQKINQANNATQAFQQATDIRNDARSLKALAYAQEKTGDSSALIATYLRLLKVAPTAETNLHLADLYRKHNKNQSALKHYENAIKLGLPDRQKTAVLAQMGMIHYDSGAYAQASSCLERAIAIKPGDPNILYPLAEITQKTGELEKALGYLQKAVDIRPSVYGLKSLANINLKLGRLDDAKKTYQQLLAIKLLPAAEKAEVMENLAYVHTQLGQDAIAADYLNKAISSGRNQQSTHKNLALILAKQQHWHEALEEFSEAIKDNPEPETLIAMAQAYCKINQPQEAIKLLEDVRLSEQSLDPKTRKNLLNELGYIYAGLSDYNQATTAWQQSLALAPDPNIALSYAHGLRVLKRTAEAKQVLQDISEESLADDAAKAQRWDELALLHETDRSLNNAIDAQKHALELAPTPSRYYQLGLLYQKSNKMAAAIAEFQHAAQQAPLNTVFAEALAYAYMNTGKPDKAAPLFEQVLAKEPQRVDLAKELGYLNIHKPDNKKAVGWFKRAIDTAQQYPDTSKTIAERKLENYHLRQEVEKLTHDFDVSAYQSLRMPDRKNDNRNTTQGGILGGIIPSQGGVQLSFRPPVIGFRDEKEFQIFTRFLWNAPPGSLNIDSDSIQGGVGIRYKPLRDHSLYLSAEHLFKVGRNSDSNWLLRASYGWSDGDGLKPGLKSWNYSTVYTDLGYFTNHSGIFAFYGEARQGYTFNFSDALLLTPHLVLDGRIQSRDSNNASYLEGGVGVAFRYLFNESHYTASRSSFELLAQYKMGIENVSGGPVLTAVFRY